MGLIDKCILAFSLSPPDTILFISTYDPWLVITSVITAVLCSLAVKFGIEFISANPTQFSHKLALNLAGLGLGVGIWTTHFVGLIGFSLPVGIAYDIRDTALSLVPVLLASILAIRISTSPAHPFRGALLAGAWLGLGCSVMHHVGLAAMDIDGLARFDIKQSLFTLGASAFLCTVGIWGIQGIRLPGLRWLHQVTALPSIISGFSLASVHYLWMESTSFMSDPQSDSMVQGYDPVWIGVAIVGLAVLFGGGVWAVFMRHFLSQIEKNNLLLNQAMELTHSGHWEIRLSDKDHWIVPTSTAEIFGLHPSPDNCYSLANDWAQYIKAIDPVAAKESLQALELAIQSGQQDYSLTYPFLRPKDGRQIWIRSMARIVSDNGGRPEHVYGAIQDVTEEFLMKQELLNSKDAAEMASKAKSEFLANMSHEIRTPMNAILGLTELALRQKLTPRLQDYLNKVHVAGKNLLSLLNDILDLSKIESGKMDIEATPFNLDDVLENLATVLSSSIEEKGLELLFDRKPDVPVRLVGDPLRLGQVLMNLCGNAKKFTEKGSIVVTTEVIDKQADKVMMRFSVKDSGIGMTQAQIAKLFQPFMQADQSITRKFGGTGLGLAISQHLLELMGGRIWVDSEVNKGSCFSFELTLIFDDTIQMSAPNSPMVVKELDQLKVLVVDDNPQAREILLSHLTHFKFRPDACADAEEALKRLSQHDSEDPYTLVLMDYRMPGLDGIAAAHRIKYEMGLTTVPKIVLVTAASRFVGEGIENLEDLLDDVVSKPVNASNLFDVIMNVFTEVALRSSRLHSGRAGGAVQLDLEGIKGARVLLVEDNSINQQVASEFLQDAGLIIEIANNGQEALEMLTANSYECVLMDLQMPVMDGYTATLHIRANPVWENLPVLAMTANVMQNDRERAIEVGMNAHIAKPIVQAELLGAMVKWLPHKTRDSSHMSAPQLSKESTEIVSDQMSLSLPGLDLNLALRNLGGNQRLLRKLLIELHADHRLDGQLISESLRIGELQTAQRIAHTLKGLAGTLGAPQLQQHCASFETSLRGKDEIAAQSALPLLISALSQVMNGLSSWIDEQNSSISSTKIDLDPEQIKGLVKSLRQMLVDMDPEAAEQALTLQKTLIYPAEKLQILLGQAATFDFEAAICTLDDLELPAQ